MRRILSGVESTALGWAGIVLSQVPEAGPGAPKWCGDEARSGVLGADDAGDGLQVGDEFDLAEGGGCQQRGDGFGLAEADFESKEAALDERGEGRGDEAAVDFEAVVSGEEREGGFVVADLDGERGAVGQGNVGRVGGDDLEMLAGDGREQIAFKEPNVAGNAVSSRVLARDCQGGGGQIDSGDLRMRQMMSEGYGDAAGAGAHIDDARSWKAGGQFEGLLDQVLGLGARDQHIRRNAKGQAVELGFADDVLNGLSPVAALEKLVIAASFGIGELLLGMGQQPGYALAENVEEIG